MTQTALVFGATGKIGTELVHRLSARPDFVVRAVTRDPSSPKAQLLERMSPRVQAITVDSEKPDAVKRAFDGVTRVMVISPLGPTLEPFHQMIARASARAGSVEMIVKVSVTGARAPDSDPPPGRLPALHFRGETILRSSGCPSVCIRPTIFAQHFLMNTGMYTEGEDRFFLPTGEAKVAWLDCRDIARCADAIFALDDEGRAEWDGRAFELTGPAGVTAAEIAKTLTAVSDRDITWIDGEDAFVARCKALNKPDGIKAIYHEAAGGWFGEVATDEFRALVGSEPTSLAKFAYDNRAYFAPRAE